MSRPCWFVIALLSAVVAVATLLGALASSSDATEAESESLLLYGCCGSIIFGAFSLYSLGMISKVNKEKRKERREEAMLTEMQMLRRQVAQQPQAAPVNQDAMQIQLASTLWKQGKRTAAIEILEAMPRNPQAVQILTKLKK